MTFKDNGNGTGTLAGTPAAGTGGSYALAITATNGTGPATQTFTLKVAQVPRYHQRGADESLRRHGGDLQGDDERLPGPSVHREGRPSCGCGLQGQRERDGHAGGHAGGRHGRDVSTHADGQKRFGQHQPELHPDRGPRRVRSLAQVGPPTSVWAPTGRCGSSAPTGFRAGTASIAGTARRWTAVPGGAVRIAVDRAGNAWVVNSAHHIFHWTGRSWAGYPGAATDIGVGANGSVWIIGAHPVVGRVRHLSLERPGLGGPAGCRGQDRSGPGRQRLGGQLGSPHLPLDRQGLGRLPGYGHRYRCGRQRVGVDCRYQSGCGRVRHLSLERQGRGRPCGVAPSASRWIPEATHGWSTRLITSTRPSGERVPPGRDGTGRAGSATTSPPHRTLERKSAGHRRARPRGPAPAAGRLDHRSRRHSGHGRIGRDGRAGQIRARLDCESRDRPARRGAGLFLARLHRSGRLLQCR